MLAASFQSVGAGSLWDGLATLLVADVRTVHEKATIELLHVVAACIEKHAQFSVSGLGVSSKSGIFLGQKY